MHHPRHALSTPCTMRATHHPRRAPSAPLTVHATHNMHPSVVQAMHNSRPRCAPRQRCASQLYPWRGLGGVVCVGAWLGLRGVDGAWRDLHCCPTTLPISRTCSACLMDSSSRPMRSLQAARFSCTAARPSLINGAYIGGSASTAVWACST